MSSILQIQTEQRPLDFQFEDLSVLRELAQRTGRRCIDLDRSTLELAALSQVPRELAEHDGLLPVAWKGSRLLVASANPDEASELEQELALATGLEVELLVAVPWQLARAQREAYDAHERFAQVWRGPAASGQLRLELVRPGPGKGRSRPVLAALGPSGALTSPPGGPSARETLARICLERRAQRPASSGKSTLEVIIDDLKATRAGAAPLVRLPENRRALIVSANALLAQTASAVLTYRSIEVLRADDVESAKGFLSGYPPLDVVLVDIRLPGDGAEALCAWVRGSAELNALRVLLLGRRFHDPHAAMKACAVLGADDAMSTDSLQTQLNQRVRALFEAPPRNPTVEPPPERRHRARRALRWLRELVGSSA